MRRGVFLRIGYFNENLGPGRSGISEPVKFAQHVIRSGGRIGDHRQPGLSGDLAKQLASELFRMGHAAFARGNINCAPGQGHTLAQRARRDARSTFLKAVMLSTMAIS